MVRSPLLVLFAALVASPMVLAGQPPIPQEPLTVADAMQLRQVVNPLLGDDFVAFQLVVPRPIEDGPGGSRLYLGVLPLVPAGAVATAGWPPEPRWLVAGKDSAPSAALRPGAREVSYLQRLDDAMQVVVQSVDGGEARPFASTPSVVAYRWRPDGKALAFTSLDAMPAPRAAAHAKGFRQVVVDEDWRHLSLYVVEAGGTPRRLTEGVTVFGFEWAPDGETLACALAPRNLVDDSYMGKRLWLVHATSGERRSLVDNPGKLGDFAWSPDGRRVGFVSAADRNDPHAGMLYTVDVATGAVDARTPGFRGMVQSLRQTETGFLCVESVGVRTRVRECDAEGTPASIYEPGMPRLAIDAAVRRGETVVFTASSHAFPAELFVQRGDGLLRMTLSNPELAGKALGEQRVVRLRARDGLPIEGLLMLPVGYEEGRRYPFVVVAHGGPEAHFHDGWLTGYSDWGQLLAARGYVSWYPNYRASTGYGVEFCKQDHGDPMGREFQDHLDAIDHFDREGLIDPARVGVGGGSYGGYTAAWAATKHSERFAAAVSFVPFVDIRTKWLTSDIPWEFYYVHYQEKWPWQQPGLLADRSPLTWAQQCKTPLLLLGGTEDPRVHPSQPFLLYRAVKFATATPVRYVQYPGEGHGNRTNVYRLDYALRTLRWFDHYLKGDGDRRKAAPPSFDVDYDG